MSQLPQTLGQPSARVVVTSANGLVVDSKEIGPASFDQLMQQEPWFRALCPASLDEYRLLNDLKYNTTIAGVITVTSDQRGHVRISLVGTFQDMENTVDNGQMEEGDDRDDSLTKFVIQADFFSRTPGQYIMDGEFYFTRHNAIYPDNIFSIDQALLDQSSVKSAITLNIDELILFLRPDVEVWTPLNFRIPNDNNNVDIMARILAAYPEFRSDFSYGNTHLWATGSLSYPIDTWSQKILKASNLATRVSIH